MTDISIKKYTIILMAIWFISILFATYNSISKSEQHYQENLELVANISYEKDILYRKWVSMHGGVYVPITKTFRPNPYLTFVEDRDIVTNKGDSLTLVNPAYMTRQVYTLGKDSYGAVGHLSSLNPINPFNTPNESEREALLRFQSGDSIFESSDTINEEIFYTHVRPFKTEVNCLKCHAHQGYKEGDIRGAIFSAVPTMKFMQIKKEEIKSSVVNLLFIWLIGAISILFVMRSLWKQMASRKIAEKKLVHSNAELLQLNADKDLFISILGHDLKSPFHNLLGLCKLLVKNIPENNREKIEKIAININRSANSSYSLLSDLLNWTKIQQGVMPFEPQNLKLRDICLSAVEFLKSDANEKAIAIRHNYSVLLSVYADSIMLETVLRNLVSNSIKFTNNGGTININAEQIGDAISISVSDNGVGIPPENISKLFGISDIISTKGTAQETGTGMGLLICKESVKKHGGKIWVESEVGKGSIFRFTIPFQ